MARIAGVDLPKDKRLEIGLTYIFGIGRAVSNEIIEAVGLNPDTRVKDLDENDIAKLRNHIEKHYMVEGDLRKDISLNIKRLTEIGAYRGIRHRKGLPTRGQNTRTNSRTAKGPRKVISGSSVKGKK
jgi:small subunit ribosomal protein S13